MHTYSLTYDLPTIYLRFTHDLPTIYLPFPCSFYSQYFIAFQEMMLAGTVAGYYFTLDKSSIGTPLLLGYWRAIRLASYR